MSPPSAYRASAGVTSDGTLDVRRVTLSGTWQGAGGKRTLNQFNKPLEGNGIALYTQVWGPTTPPKPGAVSAILFPFPAATPNTDLQAPVVELRTGGAAVPIPPGGAVLVAVGAAAAALTAEAPVGQLVTTQLNLKPDWPDIVSAIGGGPQIVRDGAPDLQGGRDLHDEPARPARAAERRRPARRRQDDPRHGRRPPARVLDRDDELRARPGARPARRRHRDGARQRRLGDDGVRRHAPEPAVRARAPDLDRAALPVHRRLRAAGRGGRLARRRRRRATSRASATRSCGPRPSR